MSTLANTGSATPPRPPFLRPARKILEKLPASVRLDTQRIEKQMKQAAFERRYHARQLLFGKAGGSLRRLSPKEQQYIRLVHSEAYCRYLHLFRTGESPYQGWTKRRQVTEIQNRAAPMGKRAHYNQWWRSMKSRYLHFDLPRKLKDE